MSPPNGSDLFGMPGLGGNTVDPKDDPTRNEYYSDKFQTPPWTLAGFPDYASYAANLRLKEEQARALSQKQLDTNAAGSGATVAAASISTQGANQRAAMQAQIDQAKNAADAAHNAATEALAKGNADEARRQFDISSQELQRYHTLDMADRQQSQQLASAKFGNDVYNKLAELASNPRNYMEQFFRMRGQTPPAGSAQYGNTSVTGPGLATFEQFLPGFLKSTGLAGGGYGYGGAPAQTATSAPAAPQASKYSGPSGASTAGLSGFDAASGKPRLSPTDPDALGLMANHPGMYTMTSPEAAKPYIDQLKAEGNNPTVYASSYRAPQQFAKGGSLTMTAPHAIVNLLSGKVAAIAGEQRGKGPQGFVPETAKFDGKAIIDPKDGMAPYNSDPSAPDPTPPPSSTPNDPSNPYSSAYNPYDPQTTPTPSAPVDYSAIGAALAASANAANPNLNPIGAAAGGLGNTINANQNATPAGTTNTIQSVPYVQPFQPIQPAPALDPYANLIQQGTGPRYPIADPNPPGPIPAQVAPQTQTPPPFQLPTGILPGPTTDTAPNPGPAPTPVIPTTNIPNPSAGFDGLSQTPSGIGVNPKFLPEDAAANDPILAQMLREGAFPPFLQRIFAQQKGLAGLGTNVPQATDLPPGVPLVSKLAYSQMTPSERSAFESYLSAHGLDLPTYLSLVEAASPQGGTSSVNPAIPRFLQQ